VTERKHLRGLWLLIRKLMSPRWWKTWKFCNPTYGSYEINL